MKKQLPKNLEGAAAAIAEWCAGIPDVTGAYLFGSRIKVAYDTDSDLDGSAGYKRIR